MIRDAVAACVEGRYFDEPASVSARSRAIGTREIEPSPIKCRGGYPDIVLLDARGHAGWLTFCMQLGAREARLFIRGIQTADPAAVDAWLRDRGVEVPSPP